MARKTAKSRAAEVTAEANLEATLETDAHTSIQEEERVYPEALRPTDWFQALAGLSNPEKTRPNTVRCRPVRVINKTFMSLLENHQPVLGFHKFLSANSLGANVDEDKILLDYRRVVVEPQAKSDKEYYHACYIDGYDRMKKMIACQAPAFGHEREFWLMLAQHKCPLVLILGRPRLQKPFWPSINAPKVAAELAFDKVRVKLSAGPVPVTKSRSYIAYHVDVHLAGVEDWKTRVVEVAGWDEEGAFNRDVIAQVAELLAVYEGLLSKLKPGSEKKLGPEKKGRPETAPLALVCRDGVSRCGTWAAVAIILERYLATAELEVRETVKTLRLQCYGAVERPLHYFHIHLAFVHHLSLGERLLLQDPAALDRLEADLVDRVRKLRAQPTPDKTLSDRPSSPTSRPSVFQRLLLGPRSHSPNSPRSSKNS